MLLVQWEMYHSLIKWRRWINCEAKHGEVKGVETYMDDQPIDCAPLLLISMTRCTFLTDSSCDTHLCAGMSYPPLVLLVTCLTKCPTEILFQFIYHNQWTWYFVSVFYNYWSNRFVLIDCFDSRQRHMLNISHLISELSLVYYLFKPWYYTTMSLLICHK